MHVAIVVLVLLGAGADPINKDAERASGLDRPLERDTRDKLRQSIHLPSGSMCCGFALNNTGDIILLDEEVRRREKIAREEKGLLGDPGNAARYRALADLYYQAKQSDKGDIAQRKAAELYRPQVAARPDDGLLLTRYADCLDCDKPKDRDEVEKLLRQAVRLAPKEWECWLNLGVFLEEKGDSLLKYIDPDNGFLPPPLEKFRGVFPEIVGQAEQCYTEALRCHDRSVSLAPREPKVYLARAGFRHVLAMVSVLDKDGRRDGNDRPFALLAGGCADLWQAARLAPNDERVLGIAAVSELLAALSSRSGGPASGDHAPALARAGRLAALPEKGKAAVEDVIVRLESMAASQSCQAASAAEILGLIYFYTGNSDKVVAWFHRAVQLNPGLDQAWDLRIAALALSEKLEEHLAACEERLQLNDTARNRFLLAAAYDCANRQEEAERVLERALRAHPNDLMCSLSLAALLMRKDKAPALARAGLLLDRAEQQLRSNPTDADALNHAVLRITFDALDGRLEAARHRLEALDPKQRADERVKELLDLLEPKHPSIEMP